MTLLSNDIPFIWTKSNS